jgi:hypothetical protein
MLPLDRLTSLLRGKDDVVKLRLTLKEGYTEVVMNVSLDGCTFDNDDDDATVRQLITNLTGSHVFKVPDGESITQYLSMALDHLTVPHTENLTALQARINAMNEASANAKKVPATKQTTKSKGKATDATNASTPDPDAAPDTEEANSASSDGGATSSTGPESPESEPAPALFD